MKKNLFIILLFIFILACPIFVRSQTNSEMQNLFGDKEEAEVIVVLKDDYNVLQKYEISSYSYNDDFKMKKSMINEQQENVLGDLKLKNKAEKLSAQSNGDYDFDLTNTYTTVNGFAGKLKKSSYEKLKNNQKVLNIYKPRNMTLLLSNSTRIINATRVWSLIYNGINLTGRGESVCVIDTGVDYTHPALQKVIAGYDFVNNDNDSIDDNGHGTHVTGIVASNDSTYRGVAPDASIVAIKMLNANGNGITSDLISSIDWCVNNASRFNISVITMSLGIPGYFNSTYCDTSENPLLVDSIHNAINKNISVVAAAGNDGVVNGVVNGVSSPACISNVTVVGSTTKSDGISSFSDRWILPILFAPGESITSTKLGGSFVTFSGTSMSAPHVAGALALLHQFKKLEQNIILTPFQIQNALNNTGKQINDSSGSGFLFSRINIFSALLSLDTTAPNITLVAPTPANGTNLSLNSTDFSVYINATSTEILSSAILEINNGSNTNISMAINGLNLFSNLTSLKIGVRKFKIYGEDYSGNLNVTNSRIFQINNTAPNISAFAPGNKIVSINEPNNQTFSINFSDSENDAITFSWFLNNSLYLSGVNKSEFNFTGNFTSAGFYFINVTLNDGVFTTYRGWNMTVNNTCDTPFEISNIIRNVTYCANQIFNVPDGITIGASNVVLDCNGSILNGNLNSGTGIIIVEKENDTITNCIIKKYQYGINATNSNRITLSFNNVSGAPSSMYITNTNNSHIMNNLLDNYDGNYSGYGIYLYNSNFNTIDNNILNKIINDGHYGGGANTDCVINSYDTAIFAYNSNFNNITSNSMSSNQHGVYSSCSNNNYIFSNNITHMLDHGGLGPNIFGIVVISSVNTTIRNNFLNISMQNDFGISIDYPDFTDKSLNTTIINNSFIGINQYFIYNNKNNLTAKFNFWGTANGTLISEKIYDYDNDNSLGTAMFEPWYLDGTYTANSDADNDGFSNSSLGGLDCNDANSSINPNAIEIKNGIDDNCNGLVDEGFAVGEPININTTTISGLNVTINQSSDLNSKFDGINEVKLKNSSELFLEFQFNFSKSALNLSNITIERQASGESQGSMLIKGINVPHQTTKTAYVDNLGLFQGVCIKDSEISSLSVISSTCTVASEIWLQCPGSRNQYNCTLNGTRLKIQGLNHSGMQQQNDTSPPIVLSITASNTGTTTVAVNLSATTDEISICRFSTLNISYENMNSMANTNNTIHSNSISYSSDTSGAYFVRCNDTFGNVMNFSNSTAFNADVQEPSSSGSSSSSGGGGGSSGGSSSGGGGGGSIGFVCNMDWECSEWSACVDGLQTRQCNFVKVTQHSQETECTSSLISPITSQKCQIKKQLGTEQIRALEPEFVPDKSLPDNKEKNISSDNITKKDEANPIIGFALKGALGKISSTLFIIFVVSLISAILFLIIIKKNYSKRH